MDYIFDKLKYHYYYEHFPNAYSFDIITCEEAAIARGVKLEQELKHILVRASGKIYMIHTPGNKRIAFNKVKSKLHIKAYVDFIDLNDLNLFKGAVCPFISSNWNYFHLFDKSIFNNFWMTTNDGTLNGYFKFEVEMLKETPRHMIEDFTEY